MRRHHDGVTGTENTRAAANEEPLASRRSSAMANLAHLAVGAGLFGLLLYPLLIATPVARYAIPVVDGVALALGLWLLWLAARRRGSLDVAIGALATAGLSLYLFVAYVTGPPPAPGGT